MPELGGEKVSASPSSEERTETSPRNFDRPDNISPESLTMDLTANTLPTAPLAASSLQQGETRPPEALGQNTTGSFGAATIKQVPSTTQKPSNNIALLLRAEEGLGKSMLSFLVGDAGSLEGKRKELIASGNQLLRSLRKQYPNLPFTIEKWNELSFEQQAALTSQYPSGALDRVKEVSARATILEAAIALQTTTINKASKTVASLDQRLLPAYMNRPLQNEVRAPNSNIEKYEYADNSILELSRQKETCLAKSIQAAESNDNADLQQQFQHAAEGAEAAIKKFQEFAQKIKEGDPGEALDCYQAARGLKLEAFEKKASASSAEYTKLEAAATSTQQAKNLREAAYSAGSAVFHFTHAHEVRVGGNEKDALAHEQAAAYYLQAAEAYAIGTPESLKQARKLDGAAFRTGSAADAFAQAHQTRADGNEKSALVHEQAGAYYLQEAEAYLIDTPESLEQAKNLSKAANSTNSAASRFADARDKRANGNEKSALANEQIAAYHLQAAEAYLIGTPESLEQAENLGKAAFSINSAASCFAEAHQERADGNEKNALVYEQAAAYWLQAAEAYAIGSLESLEQAKNLEKAADRANRAADNFDQAHEARADGNEKGALVYEQAAAYELQAAEAYLIGTPESLKQAKNLGKAAFSIYSAAYFFAEAHQARAVGNEKGALAREQAYHLQVAKYHLQAAKYHLQAAEAYAINTFESLGQVEGLEVAAFKADVAANEFAQAHQERADGNERQALALEQIAADLIKESRALADKTGKVANYSSLRTELLESLIKGDEWAIRTVDQILGYNEIAQRIKLNDPTQAERYEKAAAFLKDQFEKFGWIEDGRSQRFTRMLEAAKKIVNPQQDSCIVM